MATVSTAVEAMRHGAFDYIEKPFDAEQIERLGDVVRLVPRGDDRRDLLQTGLPWAL